MTDMELLLTLSLIRDHANRAQEKAEEVLPELRKKVLRDIQKRMKKVAIEAEKCAMMLVEGKR